MAPSHRSRQAAVEVHDVRLRAAVAAALGPGLVADDEAAPESAALLVVDAPGSAETVRERVRSLEARCGVPPLLVLLSTAEGELTRAEALGAGADELVRWPQEAGELAAKAAALLRRRELDLDAHPLTGLPGGGALYRRLERELPRRGELAVVGFDLRHFKAFNDRYGFARGDDVLQFVATLLKSVAGRGEMVYHIGGDDFVLVCRPGRAEGLSATVVELLSGALAGFYDEADRQAGCVVGLSRETGQPVRFPLLTLTVACATNEADDVTHVGQLAQILAELKEYAKQQPPGAFVRDRRRVRGSVTSRQLRSQTSDAPDGGPLELTAE